FDRAIEMKPDYAWALASRGETYHMLGREEEAVEDFDRAITIQPDYPWAREGRARSLQKLERHEDALRDFDWLLAKTPKNARMLRMRADSLVALEQPQKALDDYDKALWYEPQRTDATFGRANALRLLGRHREALVALDKALDQEPNPLGFVRRGEALVSLGRLDEAVGDFERALELDGSEPLALLGRAEARRELGELDGALADFERALEVDDSSARARVGVADVLRRLGRFDEALARFDAAIQRDPDPSLLAGRAEVLRAQGRPMEALADLHTALESAPTHRAALLERSRTYAAMERFDDAARDLDALLAQDGGDLEATYRRVVLLVRAGKTQDAESSAREAAERFADVASIHHARAIVRRALGDDEGARMALREAVRIARSAVEQHPDEPARRIELLLYLCALDAPEALSVARDLTTPRWASLATARLVEQESLLGSNETTRRAKESLAR
ncbi:MAG: tetratricopeptide repeat protein, partial [Myxococcota bacterium]|nr:tetratricopeptide repeat protein [Myxococcota bacterium]